MDHNKIVLQLNNETLALLLHKEFGKKGFSLLFIGYTKKLEEWTESEINQLMETFDAKYPASEDTRISFSLALFNYIDSNTSEPPSRKNI